MVKVKKGAIEKDIPAGALKWYKEAGWKVLGENKEENKEEANDKTNSKKITTS